MLEEKREPTPEWWWEKLVTLPVLPLPPLFLQAEKGRFDCENGHVRSFLKLEKVMSKLKTVTFAHMPFPRLPQHLKHPASGIDASSGLGGIREAQTINKLT